MNCETDTQEAATAPQWPAHFCFVDIRSYTNVLRSEVWEFESQVLGVSPCNSIHRAFAPCDYSLSATRENNSLYDREVLKGHVFIVFVRRSPKKGRLNNVYKRLCASYAMV